MSSSSMMKIVVSLLALLLSATAAAVDINTASRAELERLPGLGVATVERILLARTQRPFADWNDLAARVAGLRGKRAEQLAARGLTVDGKTLTPAAGDRQ